jgi:hypothetical protein
VAAAVGTAWAAARRHNHHWENCTVLAEIRTASPEEDHSRTDLDSRSFAVGHSDFDWGRGTVEAVEDSPGVDSRRRRLGNILDSTFARVEVRSLDEISNGTYIGEQRQMRRRDSRGK